ncbi:hypothetical protein [Clostridium sp. AWRP]|uniref:hypothetical protein n=1 Tax=Clostridium sp. AWRP TaxID=2212991 RepID=UPI001586B7AE|nr:hypothetical protein [Clostridium sp. AWRP]
MEVQNDKSTFNIYMFDSGSYDIKGYGYIRKEQIDWYKKLSTNLKKQFGKIIPSFMFFHIPLQQQYKVWQSGKAIGERNEKESPQSVDSGLFSTLIEMGDVKGAKVIILNENNLEKFKTYTKILSYINV